MLEALGINFVELAFAMANFLILVGVLVKFLYKPFLGVLEKRRQTIADAFDSAEAVNRKADEKMENYERKIAKVESEGREIIKASKQRAEAQAKIIVDEANEKASAMILAAEKEIERERIKAVGEMRTEVSNLALMAAEKIMEKDLEFGAEQDKIVDKIIEEAGKSGWQN